MSKKILTVLSEWGFWGEELIGPLDAFDAAQYEVTFVTPKGRRPVPIAASIDPNFIDPALGRTVTTREMAQRVRQLDQSGRLNNPRNLSEWVPEYPYWSEPNYLRALETYYRSLNDIRGDLAQYDLILIIGGSGPMIDVVNNSRVHGLVLNFYQMDKPIAAICYGVTTLAFARDINDRRSIIRGKHITGHTKEDDYKDGTSFANTNFNMGVVPYPLEYILRDATGGVEFYHGNLGKPTSVIVDYPFITGRTTSDAYLTGQQIVEVLEHGLRRYGW